MNQPVFDRTPQAEFYSGLEPEPMQAESSIDLRALWRTLKRSRRLIGLVTLATTVLALVISLLLPNTYTSVASFIPPNMGAGSSMASALAGQLAALGGGDLLGMGKTSGDLYAGMLRSRSVLSAIVARFDLVHHLHVKKESQAETALTNQTVIAVDAKSSIVTVSVTERSPSLAHDIAQMYLDELQKTEGRLALGQSSQRRQFFGQQLAKEKDELEDAEVQLKETEEKSGLIAPSGQTEAEIRTIAETEAQIAARQTQLAALLQSATEQNPDVIRLRSQISDLQSQLGRLQNGVGKTSAVAIPTSKVPGLQLEYVRRLREMRYHEALYEALAKQYEAARLDEAHDAPVLQVLDPASYPDSKSGPKRSLITLGGFVLGLAGAAGYVLFREKSRKLSVGAPVNDPLGLNP